MPKNFCIPVKIAEKLKVAARNGDFNIADMFKMTSAERRALWEKHVEPEMAKEINAGFEKAMVSEQQAALANWAKDVFTGKEKGTQKYKDVLQKIRDLQEQGVINPTNSNDFLEDLVATKLGAYVSAEEVQELTRRGERLQELAKLPLDKHGNLPDEYWIERDSINNYTASLAPASLGNIVLHTIGRGNMLMRLSSVSANVAFNAVKTAFNQAEMVLSEAADSLKMKQVPTLFGSNPGKVLEYVKDEVSRYNKSGFSMSRMIDVGGGQKVLGESSMHTQGPGVIRKIARVYDDIVFKTLQGTPDVVVASGAFGHTADLLSTKLAKEQGLKGAELKAKAAKIFDDATAITPQTEIGREVRAAAMEDAFRATNTHNSAYAKFAIQIRDALDTLAPNLKPGTALVPFAKTPANAVGSAIDAAGLSALSGFKDFVMRDTKTSRGAWKNAIRKIIRSGLPIAAAYLLSTYVKKNDFTGEYSTDPKKNALRKAENVIPNSITFQTPFGEKNVSTDYLGPISSVLQGIIYARDYAEDAPNKALSYLTGAGKSLLTIPGLAEYHDAYDAIDKTDLEKGTNAMSLADATAQWFANFAISRAVPGILTDIGKATDKYERQPTRGDVIGALASKLPGFRESQPIKTTFTGKQVETESALTVFLAGSRVKTPIQDSIVEEFKRLENTDQTPTIANLDKPTGRLAELQGQITPAKYELAKADYRKLYAEYITKVINASAYKKAPEDVKKARIDNINQAITMKILHKYKWKPTKKEHVYAVDEK